MHDLGGLILFRRYMKCYSFYRFKQQTYIILIVFLWRLTIWGCILYTIRNLANIIYVYIGMTHDTISVYRIAVKLITSPTWTTFKCTSNNTVNCVASKWSTVQCQKVCLPLLKRWMIEINLRSCILISIVNILYVFAELVRTVEME